MPWANGLVRGGRLARRCARDDGRQARGQLVYDPPRQTMAGGFDLNPGTVFASDFRILRALAVGGMGAVYVALQLSTKKERALKVILPRFLQDEQFRERFAL